jgi:predicted kinase
VHFFQINTSAGFVQFPAGHLYPPAKLVEEGLMGAYKEGRMEKPVLIIVNGLPGSGKTTLAKQLAHDLSLPIFSRDGIYETLVDAFAGDKHEALGSASFSLLYYVVGSVIAAGQALIIEGFFGRPDLRTAELVRLQSHHDFEPFQILCKADGAVLIERFLARASSSSRHAGHSDLEWLEQNKARLVQGRLLPLTLGGQLVEIDTTSPERYDYDGLLRRVRAVLA